MSVSDLMVRVVVALLLSCLPVYARAQAIRQLYADQPPSGSSFVRVVNAGADTHTVKLPGAGASTLSATGQIATPYIVVPGGKALSFGVDGHDLATPQPPAESSFVTIVLGNGPPVSMVDQIDRSIGLNAELIFYNLAPGCAGGLMLAGGPTVFDGVAANTSRQRAVNPVSATLAAKCGDATTPPFTMPELKAGQYYSLFLVGTPAAPKLVGMLDQTAPFQGRDP